jgi:hypothetical protein
LQFVRRLKIDAGGERRQSKKIWEFVVAPLV